MEAADATIDKLATEGRLNPALLLTMAKAYSAAKETDKTKDEVKEIMAHLYFKVCLKAIVSGCRAFQGLSEGCSIWSPGSLCPYHAAMASCQALSLDRCCIHDGVHCLHMADTELLCGHSWQAFYRAPHACSGLSTIADM